MDNLNSILTSLENKTEKLLHLHRQIKKELSDAQSQNAKLKEIIEQQKQTISSYEEKNKILRLSKSLSTTNENTTELKHKLNELIREVDKCIALLNK
jgi:chromosome segregation ATPase